MISIQPWSQIASSRSVSLTCRSAAWDRYAGERFQWRCTALGISQAEPAPLSPSLFLLLSPKKKKKSQKTQTTFLSGTSGSAPVTISTLCRLAAQLQRRTHAPDRPCSSQPSRKTPPSPRLPARPLSPAERSPPGVWRLGEPGRRQERHGSACAYLCSGAAARQSRAGQTGVGRVGAAWCGTALVAVRGAEDSGALWHRIVRHGVARLHLNLQSVRGCDSSSARLASPGRRIPWWGSPRPHRPSPALRLHSRRGAGLMFAEGFVSGGRNKGLRLSC